MADCHKCGRIEADHVCDECSRPVCFEHYSETREMCMDCYMEQRRERIGDKSF
ncbi:hypothetical protein ACEU6E_10400 [Halorutilales archaeon Cl-col2-1]